MTNFFEICRLQIFGELVPPVGVALATVGQFLHLKLGQLGSEIHDGDGHNFRLPQETDRGAETAIEQHH